MPWLSSSSSEERPNIGAKACLSGGTSPTIPLSPLFSPSPSSLGERPERRCGAAERVLRCIIPLPPLSRSRILTFPEAPEPPFPEGLPAADDDEDEASRALLREGEA